MTGDFVQRGSVVRRVWGDPDMVLLIFAGSAAEFALNRAVDWLFFTGRIPADPFGRLFSTVRYAQEIVFADEAGARRTLGRINAAHDAVMRQRGRSIPDWAFRDVLYMLVAYSERSHELMRAPLTSAQREELYGVFRRVGEGLRIRELPDDYAGWRLDRREHIRRDLAYSRHTERLYAQYRRHLGAWRYQVLLGVQALLAPAEVRGLLRLRPSSLLSALTDVYALAGGYGLRPLVHRALVSPRYWPEVEALARS